MGLMDVFIFNEQNRFDNQTKNPRDVKENMSQCMDVLDLDTCCKHFLLFDEISSIISSSCYANQYLL